MRNRDRVRRSDPVSGEPAISGTETLTQSHPARHHLSEYECVGRAYTACEQCEYGASTPHP